MSFSYRMGRAQGNVARYDDTVTFPHNASRDYQNGFLRGISDPKETKEVKPTSKLSSEDMFWMRIAVVAIAALTVAAVVASGVIAPLSTIITVPAALPALVVLTVIFAATFSDSNTKK